MTPIQSLKELLAKAPDFPDLPVEVNPLHYYSCPLCGGDGDITGEQVEELKSSTWAGGVQFYGCGDEHVTAEKLYVLARLMLPQLIEIAEASDRLLRNAESRDETADEIFLGRDINDLRQALSRLGAVVEET